MRRKVVMMVAPDGTSIARATLLTHLIALSEPVRETIGAAAGLPWDGNLGLVTLTARDVRAVLQRYLDGELFGKDVEGWAEVVHSRDEVELDEATRGTLAQFLFEASTPELVGELTPQSAQSWLDRLDGVPMSDPVTDRSHGRSRRGQHRATSREPEPDARA